MYEEQVANHPWHDYENREQEIVVEVFVSDLVVQGNLSLLREEDQEEDYDWH